MTKKYKVRKRVCFWLSLLCWLGLCGFLIAYGISTALPRQESEIGRKLMEIFIPLSITYLVALVLVLFIREKMRNTVWMANIILSAVLLGEVMLYVSIALFAVDEFILVPLYKRYKTKYEINVEIDKR